MPVGQASWKPRTDVPFPEGQSVHPYLSPHGQDKETVLAHFVGSTPRLLPCGHRRTPMQTRSSSWTSPP